MDTGSWKSNLKIKIDEMELHHHLTYPTCVNMILAHLSFWITRVR